MAFFFNKTLDAKEFAALIHDLADGSLSNRVVDNVSLKNLEIPIQALENLHFKSCNWDTVDAHEKNLRNVIFENCNFSNVNMRDAHLINVQFINSKLHNVVMNNAKLEQVKFRKSKLDSTDSNIDNGYNGLQADEIIFDDCDLTNIGFYKVKGIFRFDKSRLYDVAGQSLAEGSALYIHNTHASILNFDRSKLSNLEILNSTIDKRSSAGGGSIKNIRVVNSKLEFSLGDNSNIEHAVFENSGDVVVGGGKNHKNFMIKNCPKGTYVINAGGNGFEKLEIENCDVSDVFIPDSIGAYVSLKNVSTHSMDFRDSQIEKLVLDNVTVRGKIKYQNTNIKNFESKDVSFGKNIKVWNENSNIEIKPDKILED